MEEVDTTKGSRYKGIDLAARALQSHGGPATDVGEHVALSHLDQRKFSVIAVSEEI